jgi:hypothetical protein
MVLRGRTEQGYLQQHGVQQLPMPSHGTAPYFVLQANLEALPLPLTVLRGRINQVY